MRRSGHLVLIIVTLGLVVGAPDSVCQQPERQASPTLTKAHDVHSLTSEQAARNYPVHLHAVVTYYDPYIDPHHPTVWVSDSSGGIYVELSSVPAVPFKAGDLVEITGTSAAAGYAPIIRASEARSIGRSPLPATPLKVTLAQILTGAEDGQWVEVEGVVHAVRESGKNIALDLALSDGEITASTVKQVGVNYDSLIDAKIRLRGNQAPLFNQQGAMTGAYLLFPDRAQLTVEEPAPANPFTLPVSPVSGLLRFKPKPSSNHRRHIHGTVTLFWPGRLLCIQDGLQGLCAQTDQTTPLSPGELVDVIGFPIIGAFTPTLTSATYEAAGYQHSARPITITAEQALQGNHDAELVELQGQVVGQDKSASHANIVLSSQNQVFSAVLPAQAGMWPAAWENGTTLKVVGVCSMKGGPNRSGISWDGFSVPQSFRILLRSSRDVVVIKRRSWWTPIHGISTLGSAAALALMVLTWVFVLRRRNADLEQRVAERTEALQETLATSQKAEEQLARLAGELARQAEDLALSRGDLEAQTSMLKLVLESMGEGLIAADQAGHFLLWNDAASALMGRGPSDLPTEQWTPHYKVFLADGTTPCPPDRLPLVRALCGESVKVELMIQPPELEPGKFIEVTARPLKDARGNRRGGVAVLHDITERKRSETDLAQQTEELRHSQQALKTQTFMLQSVLDSMVEGLVAADEHGKFILWNPAADKIMGLGATNLAPTEWAAHYGLFLPDTVTPVPPGQTPLERTLRGEGGTSEVFLRHDGLSHGLWLEATGSPLIDKDGVIRGGVLAFRDITRRKTDELEIRKLNEDLEDRIATRTEQLQATNHELEAFSYSISHDLRTPLRHIAGFARILVNDFGPAMVVEAREHLQGIEDAVSRMGMMVDALLKMAVLRRKALRLEHSELNPIVDEVISMLQPECQGRNVEWRIARLPALDCDPILMAQVFQNLLGNALKYSRGRVNAVIEVGSIQQADKPPIIFVRDNGTGFNMRYAGKLFDVFQRFHTESEFEGTGVGLATVHRIIQKHGGTIWAEAELDHGATFYFALQMTEQIRTTPKPTAVS